MPMMPGKRGLPSPKGAANLNVTVVPEGMGFAFQSQEHEKTVPGVTLQSELFPITLRRSEARTEVPSPILVPSTSASASSHSFTLSTSRERPLRCRDSARRSTSPSPPSASTASISRFTTASSSHRTAPTTKQRAAGGARAGANGGVGSRPRDRATAAIASSAAARRARKPPATSGASYTAKETPSKSDQTLLTAEKQPRPLHSSPSSLRSVGSREASSGGGFTRRSAPPWMPRMRNTVPSHSERKPSNFSIATKPRRLSTPGRRATARAKMPHLSSRALSTFHRWSCL
mmetsp:Transcript_40771/g.131788  ORF Transcript_40771/g.131788 Transcript_40771/m.131788 type:complete len:289 (-) Transcript_40771:245-1111(-)